jgi:hypothetical protein
MELRKNPDLTESGFAKSKIPGKSHVFPRRVAKVA